MFQQNNMKSARIGNDAGQDTGHPAMLPNSRGFQAVQLGSEPLDPAQDASYS